jgi:hypothetical protein
MAAVVVVVVVVAVVALWRYPKETFNDLVKTGTPVLGHQNESLLEPHEVQRALLVPANRRVNDVGVCASEQAWVDEARVGQELAQLVPGEGGLAGLAEAAERVESLQQLVPQPRLQKVGLQRGPHVKGRHLSQLPNKIIGDRTEQATVVLRDKKV